MNNQTLAPVTGTVKSVHVYMNMSFHTFTLPNGTAVQTCPPAMGKHYLSSEYFVVVLTNLSIFRLFFRWWNNVRFYYWIVALFCVRQQLFGWNRDGPGAFDFVQGDNASMSQ
jgi:hypothetical protein